MMKHIRSLKLKAAFFILIFIFLQSQVSAQAPSKSERFSIDINAPIPVGNNFIKQYSGLGDIGIKYNLLTLGKIRLGFSTNVGLLKLHESSSSGGGSTPTDFSVNALMIKPRFNGEISIGRITPYLGLGYSIFDYIINPNVSGLDQTNDGLNINPGLRVKIISRAYINLSYDFIRFRNENSVLNNSYNRDIQIVKVGAGISI